MNGHRNPMKPDDISVVRPLSADQDTALTGVDLSVVALLGANLLPLYGALFDGWSVLNILLVYWAENVIVGALTVLEMLTVAVADGSAAEVLIDPYIPFFCLHYGMFTTVHGALIYAMFGNGPFAHGGIRPEYWHYLYEPFLPGHPLFYSVLTILFARLNAYRVDFLGGGEYRCVTVAALMFRPYGRVMILHVVVLLGAWLAMASGSSVAALALLVLIKIVIDMVLHLRARKRTTALS